MILHAESKCFYDFDKHNRGFSIVTPEIYPGLGYGTWPPKQLKHSANWFRLSL